MKRHFERSNEPVWVAVENRGEVREPDQYFVGKAIGIENVHTERVTVGRTRYDAGDVEFAVNWYARHPSGGEERRIFQIWVPEEITGNTEELTRGPPKKSFNSTELRAIRVPMQKVPSPGADTPVHIAQRLPARRGHVLAAAGFRRVVTQYFADPPDMLWEIPPADERMILDNCA